MRTKNPYTLASPKERKAFAAGYKAGMIDAYPDGIDWDPNREILTIDGIEYARNAFKFLAEINRGNGFQIVKRDDGVLTVRELTADQILT
jgi:hypothetical protein